ncbi:hypothetical protein CPB84DRAFT_1851798 [Gymnopilus junonius]|uniref:Uncharacterized protein n=1 Tax=Gymnopilus junonius TaxID=109634 RepID=A0A9P5NEU4_GYMJU|nr:hypothetical protein CPB84DRAFT_1851798 [Gymnopilus junonius]
MIIKYRQQRLKDTDDPLHQPYHSQPAPGMPRPPPSPLTSQQHPAPLALPTPGSRATTTSRFIFLTSFPFLRLRHRKFGTSSFSTDPHFKPSHVGRLGSLVYGGAG